MFRTYQVFWNRLFLLIDGGGVILSFLIAWELKFNSGWLEHGSHYPLRHYWGVISLAIPVFIFSNWAAGLYRPMRARPPWRMLTLILRSLVVGLLIYVSLLYFIHVSQLSRSVLVIFGLVFAVLGIVKQLTIQGFLRWLRSRGYNKKFVVIIGWTAASKQFVENLKAYPWFGYSVVGFIDSDKNTEEVKYLGGYEDLDDILESSVVDHVLICLPRAEVFRVPNIVSLCESLGIQSLIIPDYFDVLPANPRFESFAGMPLIDTRYVPLDDALNATLKRLFDILFSLVVLVILSPIFMIIGLAIKLSSPGPVIFRQERLGLNRRPFTMYKFRTMVYEGHESSTGESGAWTIPNDPRRTRVGVFLRKTSLDELPQFWNVLLGNMSVIGPRPERAEFVERFREEVPKYMVKHRVRPGITGWAQVHGWRGDTSILERIRYDIDYIEHWSFSMDLRIVFITILNGFKHENAY